MASDAALTAGSISAVPAPAASSASAALPTGGLPTGGLPERERTAAQGSQPPDDSAPRELVYRVQPDGLRIDYDGMHLEPHAEPRKLPNGGYGLELVVDVKAQPAVHQAVLLSNGSPLSVFARVLDKHGREKRSSAQQLQQATTQPVCAGCPTPWQASWPLADETPLWWGQRVVLEVGLWGIGDDESVSSAGESDRSVPPRSGSNLRVMQRLFVVEYQAGAKTAPLVRPPDF